jgi:hypothetical protein
MPSSAPIESKNQSDDTPPPSIRCVRISRRRSPDHAIKTRKAPKNIGFYARNNEATAPDPANESLFAESTHFL